MANRYGGSYRNGTNGYGNLGPPPPRQPQPPQQAQQRTNDDYDPYGDGYSSSNGTGGGNGSDRYVSASSSRAPRDRNREPDRNWDGGERSRDRDRTRDIDRDWDTRRGGAVSSRTAGGRPQPRYPPSLRPGGGGGGGGGDDEDDDDGNDYYDTNGSLPVSRREPGGARRRQAGTGGGTSSSSVGAGNAAATAAERRIGQDALDRIRAEWPAMCATDCVPVQMALQLLDASSVGRAHEYRAFQRTHAYLQDSLKTIVHDYHQGFNSAIGTFHTIQGSIQASQKRVRGLKAGLASARASLCSTDPALAQLHAASQRYDALLQTLNDLDELRQVPERLEARISEKQFLTAVDVLQHALRKLRRPELDSIGALSDLRSYLANQETALLDILVEELHEHLYLKSPYCQERWQALAKHQGDSAAAAVVGGSTGGGGAGVGAGTAYQPTAPPFFLLLDTMDLEHAVQEDPARNPESDTFYYVTLVVESLNKLGRLEAAVHQLKQRLPVELFTVVHETVNEVDQKHPTSLRGGSRGMYGWGGGSGVDVRSSNSTHNDAAGNKAGTSGNSNSSSSSNHNNNNHNGNTTTASSDLHIYGRRETQLRADVIYDLLWTLYGKFEAIAEGHRIFHEYIKALIRREGAGNNSALLGSFKELWNLYQNEIRSLLHNYVTTDADLYRFTTGGPGGVGGGGGLINGAGFFANGRANGMNGAGVRDSIFKFNEADAKSLEMATEYEALDGIIRAAVPGLTSNNGGGSSGSGTGNAGRKAGAADNNASIISNKKLSLLGASTNSVRKSASYDVGGPGAQPGDIHKPLVEPSVFNMSLLLPPTLVFLQRLRGIVPPGSDLAASTLTSFLDNFLVNVFQPQLDETLGTLSDAVFGEADAFQPDPAWRQVARRPVFTGTTAFFSVVTAFCRMLGTIPHDQALSALIITQMMRYYDRCFSWYKALVTKTQDQEQEPTAPAAGAAGAAGTATATASTTVAANDAKQLRMSAVLALQLEGSEVADTARALWAVENEEDGGQPPPLPLPPTATGGAPRTHARERDRLLQKEVDLLLARTSGSAGTLGMGDVISDRDAITSLCLLYTSMKWLAVKVGSLRHITQQDTDSSRASLAKPDKQRWTLLNDTNKALVDDGPVYLPMTQETVQSFDSIVSSYEELAATALLTLHLEVRCRIAYALGVALSPAATAPYLLDQDVREPDPQILALNFELLAYDETVVRCLRDREVAFVRTGLGRLINAYLVGNARMVTPMNNRGCGRMQLNILVLQQNLKNVEDGVDLARAANYYALFEQGPDAMVAKAQACKERREQRQQQRQRQRQRQRQKQGGGAGTEGSGNDGAGEGGLDADADANGDADLDDLDDLADPDMFTYDELKELLELYYSEQLANPERGIENAARRQMGEKLMELGEHLWQM